MSGPKPIQDHPSNPFADDPSNPFDEDIPSNPFADEVSTTTLTVPEPSKPSRLVIGAKALGSGAVKAIKGLPDAIVDFADTGADIFYSVMDPRNLVNGKIKKENKEKALARLQHLKETAVDPGVRAALLPFELIAGREMTDDEFKNRMEEFGGMLTIIGGPSVLGKMGKAGIEVARKRNAPKGTDAGPAPPDAPALTGEMGGPKSPPPKPGATPTPEQIAARTAKVAELKAKGVAVEKAQKAATGQKQFAARAWTALSSEQRKALYPGMADLDYTKPWRDLTDEAKTVILERTPSRASSDAPSGATTSGVPGIVAPPEAPAPATEIVAPQPSKALAENVRHPPVEQADIEAIRALPDDRLIEELYVTSADPVDPSMPHLIEEAGRRGIDWQKSIETASLVRTQLGIQSGIPSEPSTAITPAKPPTAIEQLAADLGITPDQMVERMRAGTPLTVERLAQEKGMPDIPEADPLTPQPVLPTPGKVVGEIKPVKKTRAKKAAKPTTPKEPSKHEVGSVTDRAKSLLRELDKLGVNQEINAADAITRLESTLAERKAKPNPGLSEAGQASQIKEIENLLLGYGRVAKGYDINARLKEFADKAFSHKNPEDLARIIEELRAGQKPDLILEYRTEIEALIKAGAKYPAATTSLSTGKPADAGQGLTTTPESVPAPRPEGPSLDAQQVKTAREVVQELERQIDEIDAAHDAGQLTDAQYVDALRENTRKRQEAARLVPGVTDVVKQSQFSVKLPDTLGKDLNTFTTRQLINTKKTLAAQIQDPQVLADQKAMLQAEFDRIVEWAKNKKKQDEGGFIVLPGRRKVIKKIDEATMTESEKYMSRRVLLEPELSNPWNWVKNIRHRLYMGIMRPSHPYNVAVRLYETASGESVGAHAHPGKLQEMMDGSLTKAEGFLRGDGPIWPDGQGGQLRAMFPDETGLMQPVKSLAGVVETAGGDVERLGWLWAATRALELKALKNKNIGIDLGHAQEIFINAPENLHRAVREGRNYHLALAQLGRMEGLIKPEAIAEFANETAYGPIQRIFDEKYMKKVVEEMKIGDKPAKTVLGSQPFKRLKGSDLPMLNMVENSIPVTYRILRATNINRFALSLVDLARKQPDQFKGIIEPVDYRLSATIRKDMKLKEEAVKEMFSETGIDISEQHASLFANILVDDAISVDGGVIKVFNGGKVELWRVSSLIAESIRSMSPTEQSWTLRAFGAPAHTLRLGIVLDPLFMANQMLIDQFQGWFNTRYGFRPFYDSFRGWWHLIRESEVAKEAMKAGGVERAGLRTRTGLAEVIAGPSLSPLPLAHQEIATFHPFKALNTLLTPMREATRMGEYLRARDAGASPVEAAWSARDILGNYSVEGTFPTIRALNYISAFGRPALAVIDKTGRVIADNPGRWFFRGMVTLGLGAALLYVANMDDEEIRNLRQTPGGQRWFYFRMGDKIGKVRKPYGEGAIFASGMEAFLDMMYKQNPDALRLWGKAMTQEVAVNMLPVLGVMAAEAWANKSYQTGSRIIPEDEKGLDPEYQVGYRATTADRVIGETMGVSPAMINYVVRGVGGYLGESVVLAVSTAMDWNRTGELPPAEDWPFTQRLFARYPSYGVAPIRKFYENADKVDRAAKTLEMVYKDRPDRLMIEMNQHGSIMELAPLIEQFNATRQEIADLRRAAEWLDPLQDVGPATKAIYRKSFLEQIILKAQTANLIADPIMKANDQARKANKTNTTKP